MSETDDRWAAGSMYEDFMGRWSRRLALEFIAWLQEPSGVHWLDVGCGTGALTDAICGKADPASVVGCDPSEPFVEYAREKLNDERSSFVIAGIGALPTRPGGFGSVTSCLALNFFPDAELALEEMLRVAAGAGTVSACVWDYGGRMELLRCFWDAVSSTDPGARELDEGIRFPFCRYDALVGLFRRARLGQVRCDPIEITTEFADFEEYWRPVLGGTGPAPSYVASLDEDRRRALAGKLDRILPRQPDGSITLAARAWAIRGSKG